VIGGLALRGLRERWPRAALTGVAAVVGVAVVSGTLIVSDTADRLGYRDENLELARKIMLIAGGVALIVGAFIVNVMVSVTVAQRTRELAMLRCVGADSRQVRRLILAESAGIGAAASAVGLLLGLGVAAAIRALVNSGPFAARLPGHALAVTPRTVIAAVVMGCGVLVLSAQGSATRAGRLAPLAALRDAASEPGPWPRRRGRYVAGTLVLGAGLASLPAAVATWLGPLLLPGAVLTLAGLRLLGPPVARWLARAVGRPLAALGEPLALGRANSVRNPERTAATASALTIGLALVAFTEVLAASTLAPMLREYARDRADFQVSPVSDPSTKGDGTLMDPAVVDRLRALPGLAAVVPVECSDVCAADPAAIAQVKDLVLVAGSLSDVGPDRVGVSDRTAEREGWTLGSAATIGGRTRTVAAIFEAVSTFDSYLIPPAQANGDRRPMAVYVRVAPGANLAAARAALAGAVAAFPGLAVQGRDSIHRHDLEQISGATNVYRGLTGLAALLGLVGIAGTLALSVVERRRELGLVRAVGMQRRQVRSMVRAESVIVGLVGAALGISLGLAFGWAAAKVFTHSSQPTIFTVPIRTLVAIAALAALAGLAAAVVPARMASRVDVLTAVATE
jgi:putative ABC transport system permease protein